MKLEKNIILEKLSKLNNWLFTDDTILKDFVFKDFSSALAFVVKVGIIAEKIDHHPNIELHSWNKVKITCYTHSSNGITEKDFELVSKIESEL